jgi:glycosyltransferase involved in cell wall biosynthesis
MSAQAQRLLSINNYHYRRGGAEAVYFDHDALFRSLGWETAFFSMQHPKNEPSDYSRFFVDEIELGHDYSLFSKLAMAPKIIYSREARRKLAALLDAFPADVAHVHSVYHHISPAILPLLHERDIPVVLTAHDLKLLCPAYTMLSNGEICEACKPNKVWNVAAKRCIKGSLPLSALIGIESGVHRLLNIYGKNVARVVAPSRFYRDKFIEWGWPAAQVEYIPNYVNVEQFSPAFKPADYFLYFGRLVKDKGVHTLIAASAQAGVKLKVAGTGPHADEFAKLAVDLNADVEFLGFRSGAELHALIRDARAVVLPSEWYENAPISVLEAYALGTPVIGADIGGIPEMIDRDQTGWLFASGATDELAAALQRAAALPVDAYEAMGRSARARVEADYTAAVYTQAMRQLYKALAPA